MIDLKRSQDQILEITPVLGRESVPILDALGRILKGDVFADNDIPAADISAVDGYAVRHGSLAALADSPGVELEIIGESPAGRPCGAVVGPGQAVRIMTGGLVPQGADTVVKQEYTTEIDGYVICTRDPGPGRGIRPRGDSLKAGDLVLRSGDMIGPLEVGALASLRRAYVHVHQRPLVAVLSTGDELSDFHESLSPWKAMCSNIYALAAQIRETGARELCLGIVRDDLDELRGLLNEALGADVIITSGGTSRGKYDLVHKAFASLGMETRFSTLFAKPGKPTVFGTLGRRLVFCLPGNPSATMLSFEQFIKPVLLRMMGHTDRSPASHTAGAPFARFDSFNAEHGGNKEHRRAPQVPVVNGWQDTPKHPGNAVLKPAPVAARAR